MDGKQSQSTPTPRYKLKNVLTTVGLILLFVALTVSQTRIYRLKGSQILFHALINLNIILLLIVVMIIVRYLIRLFYERPGSRFRQKLVIAFLISTLLPASLLFFISTTFIRDTLDTWLNPIHGEPLNDAMAIVRILHNYYQERGAWFGSRLAKIILEQDLLDTSRRDRLETFIREKQREYNLGMIQVFDDHGVELMRAINENVPIGSTVETPSTNLEAALSGGKAPPELITAGGGTLYRTFLPLYRPDMTQASGVIVVNFFVTERLMPRLQRIQRSSEKFQQQQRLRQPIRQEYLYLFLLPTVLVLFFATWFGFYLSKGVIFPIQRLAEGTRAIATGNLDFQLDITAYDEIGMLVDSFESMRQELKKNQQDLEDQTKELQGVNRELDREQHYMASILKSFTTGVISFDNEGIVTTVNPAAQTMLQVEPHLMIGRHYNEAFDDESLLPLRDMIEKCMSLGVPMINRELHFYSTRITQHLSVSLSVIREPEGERLGVAMVLEDLTELFKIQKTAAWSEVARRIAHEIKNPLTPIRLSAQRIQRKIPQEAESTPLISDLCRTIVTEVDTIQRLVNSFSRFARMPEALPVPTEVNRFVETFLDAFAPLHPMISITRTIAQSLPLVNIDENLMKQALTNIIDNAAEAMSDRGNLDVTIEHDRFLSIVRIEIADSGPGIPADDREKLFIPYFSTKKKGTGLGLAIVSRIIADHYGYIRVADNQPHGTRMIIELPVILNPLSEPAIPGENRNGLPPDPTSTDENDPLSQ